MSTPPGWRWRRSQRRHLLAGVGLVALFGCVTGFWATAATITSAVIATGQVVVDSNVKKVQHPSGGVVAALKVRDGDRVREGELLIRLDDTITRTNREIVAQQLDELATRRIRLVAERDSSPAPGFDASLFDRTREPALAGLIEAERSLFAARRAAREGQKEQLQKRISQLGDEIRGLKAQQEAKTRETVIIAEELKGVRSLFAKNLVQATRLNALEREAANLDGQRGQLVASVAQAEGRIAETEIQIIRIDQDLRTEVLRELREIQSRIAELMERKAAAEDQLKRVDISAPRSGIVHQLAVHTIGGVVGPGETIMSIVPDNDSLQVEARIAPQDIDQIATGQSVVVRLSAFNQRTTPEITGRLARVSGDLSHNRETNASWYTVRVSLPSDLDGRLKAFKLLPGMPAEVSIATGDRTPLDYLLKPLRDQFARAFREE